MSKTPIGKAECMKWLAILAACGRVYVGTFNLAPEWFLLNPSVDMELRHSSMTLTTASYSARDLPSVTLSNILETINLNS